MPTTLVIFGAARVVARSSGAGDFSVEVHFGAIGNLSIGEQVDRELNPIFALAGAGTDP